MSATTNHSEKTASSDVPARSRWKFGVTGWTCGTKNVALTVAFLFFVFFLGCGKTPLPVTRGLAVVGPATFHFGDVCQNQEVWHDFVLTNEAEVSVLITGLKSSCGCTWAANNDKIVGSTLSPNEALDFPVFLHVGARQTTASGKIVLAYRHQTEDDRSAFEGELLLTVEATVLSDYRMEPLELDFGEINGLNVRQVKTTFRITPDQLKSLEVTDVKPSVDFLSARILSPEETSVSEGYEVEVGLDLSSFIESRPFRGHLVISTNSKTLPKGIVQVKTQYISPVDIRPSSIMIGSDKEGTVEEAIQVRTSSPSKLVRVDTTDQIRAEFSKEQLSDLHDVKFFVEPCRDAEIDETVTLELSLFPSDGKDVSITCPVSVYRFRKGE